MKGAAQGADLFQRRLPRATQFQFFLVIYNASHGAQLDMRVRILLGGKALLHRPVPPDSDTGGQLVPDHYTLEVTVIDKLAKMEPGGLLDKTKTSPYSGRGAFGATDCREVLIRKISLSLALGISQDSETNPALLGPEFMTCCRARGFQRRLFVKRMIPFLRESG